MAKAKSPTLHMNKVMSSLSLSEHKNSRVDINRRVYTLVEKIIILLNNLKDIGNNLKILLKYQYIFLIEYGCLLLEYSAIFEFGLASVDTMEVEIRSNRGL